MWQTLTVVVTVRNEPIRCWHEGGYAICITLCECRGTPEIKKNKSRLPGNQAEFKAGFESRLQSSLVGRASKFFYYHLTDVW